MEGNISGDIKKHRERLGFTQEEMADKLKVNRKTVGEWESGESTPSKTSRKKLSNLFGVEVTIKGIMEPHFTNMKVEKPEKSELDEDWYKKTIDSLIQQHENIIDKYTTRTDHQINELENDKLNLWELVRGRVKPPQEAKQ